MNNNYIQNTKKIHAQSGFTLEELLVVIGIVATLASLVPSMLYAMSRTNNVAITLNRLTHDLALTRIEAVRANEQYVICKSNNGQECVRNNKGWEQGWIIFKDSNHSRNREQNERIAIYQPAFNNSVEIKYHAFGSKHYVTYRPSGFTKTNGTFHICGDKQGQFAKALVLFKTGRVRLSAKNADIKPDCSQYSS